MPVICPLEPVSPTSLRDDVLRSLRSAIVRGALRPGQRLQEAALARELHVSRGPVREALIALEREGLVVFSPNRSPRVAAFTGEEFKDLVEVRWLLETYAVRKALPRLTPADLSRLEASVQAMRRAVAEGDRPAAVEADLSFHEQIVALAGNKRLYQVWSQLAGHIRLFITLSVEAGFDLAGMADEHAQVLAALRSGDGGRAADAVNQHNREIGEAIARLL